MSKQEFLAYVGYIYEATRSVMQAVPHQKLNYRPRPEMMSIGQLMHHMSSICGGSIKQVFEGNFPPADPNRPVQWSSEKDLHECRSVQEALDRLNRDEASLKIILNQMDNADFRNRNVQPPWSPKPFKAWLFCLLMADHLSLHRMQLYQYLRLLGEPVDTLTLYGLHSPHHALSVKEALTVVV